MELHKYKIVALPFAQSDMEAEFVVRGIDETDARRTFEARNPGYMVKEVKAE